MLGTATGNTPISLALGTDQDYTRLHSSPGTLPVPGYFSPFPLLLLLSPHREPLCPLYPLFGVNSNRAIMLLDADYLLRHPVTDYVLRQPVTDYLLRQPVTTPYLHVIP